VRSVSYLCVSLAKTLLRNGQNCPSCGASAASIVDRKWIVTSLHRCENCKLLYRVPTTSARENSTFYQTEYVEGFTTELPDSATLEKYVSTNFKGSSKDYSVYVDVLAALGVRQKAQLYDFGCSWGYGTYQLRTAGFDAKGFEISEPRARFAATQLGILLRHPESVPNDSIDVFFSAHVLEHVPSVQTVLSVANRMLRRGGWFVAFTPNGSLERRLRDPLGWHQAWGFVHPQLLDREWINARALNLNVVADTDPYDIESLKKRSQSSKWNGSELLFAYQKL
jgi:2-polyprenyl-3-methyl-5-hydroxy-6-metoxy-1,4-benzoquinol methylase